MSEITYEQKVVLECARIEFDGIDHKRMCMKNPLHKHLCLRSILPGEAWPKEGEIHGPYGRVEYIVRFTPETT